MDAARHRADLRAETAAHTGFPIHLADPIIIKINSLVSTIAAGHMAQPTADAHIPASIDATTWMPCGMASCATSLFQSRPGESPRGRDILFASIQRDRPSINPIQDAKPTLHDRRANLQAGRTQQQVFQRILPGIDAAHTRERQVDCRGNIRDAAQPDRLDRPAGVPAARSKSLHGRQRRKTRRIQPDNPLNRIDGTDAIPAALLSPRGRCWRYRSHPG